MREHMQAMRDAIRPQIAKAWSEVAKPQADEIKVMQLLDEAAQTRHRYVHDLTATTLAYSGDIVARATDQIRRAVALGRRARGRRRETITTAPDSRPSST